MPGSGFNLWFKLYLRLRGGNLKIRTLSDMPLLINIKKDFLNTKIG